MDGVRFDAIVRRAARASATRRETARLVAAGVGAVLPARLGLRTGVAACLEPGLRCGHDSECCSGMCDNGACRSGVPVLRFPEGGNCRAAGAPCDQDGQCCSRLCRSNAGVDFPGGLPPRTCWIGPEGCPGGGTRCRARDYAGEGPDWCCAAGDTCAADGAGGCVTQVCRAENEGCQDVWGDARCGNSRWCVCVIEAGGGHACANMEGVGSCPSGRQCQYSTDCPGDQICSILPPGCCQNPGQTVRACLRRCGGYSGGTPPPPPPPPADTCPDGRPRCKARPYSGHDAVCCAPGDECTPDWGCRTATCRAENDMCPGPWASATCGGGKWCFCVTDPDGGHACANFEGVGSCPNRSNCQHNADCPGDQVCAVYPPGCCGNPGQTLRVCRPRCGAGVAGATDARKKGGRRGGCASCLATSRTCSCGRGGRGGHGGNGGHGSGGRGGRDDGHRDRAPHAQKGD